MDAEFVIDQRHADVAKRAAKVLRQADIEDGDHLGEHPENKARNAETEDRLRSFVERIERLEAERKDLGADIKDVYAEAKSAGFNVTVLRQLIKIRKQDASDVEEVETLLDIYRRALGM